MNEERFAFLIRRELNHSLNQISPAAKRKLEAARHHALRHQRVAAAEFAFAPGGLAARALQLMPENVRSRHFFAALALSAGMAIAFYWHGNQFVAELEEVDSAVLSSSLPPDAFLDRDFVLWLDDSSDD